jgi:Zn finger protein HypA/HybF involved in hydrogenase expression
MTKAMGARTDVQAGRCHRCGGLMVPEQVFEIRSIDWRCVSCGERIDPVILAHRKQDVARVEVEEARLY